MNTEKAAPDEIKCQPNEGESVDPCKYCSKFPCIVDDEFKNKVAERRSLLPPSKSAKQARFFLYKFASRYIKGWLGRGNRVRLPSCVVQLIQSQFPSDDGLYVGFKEAQRHRS